MKSRMFSRKALLVLMLVLTAAPSVAAASSRLVGPVYGLEGEMTAALTEWTIPTPNSAPSGLALDPSGECCWFVESSGNKVVRFDPSTDKFQEWAIPTPDSKPTSVALTTIAGSVVVFGTETAKDKVFIFFPKTGMFREYTLPSGSSTLYISIEPGGPKVKAWFTGLGNLVGEIIYDPSSGTVRMYQLSLPAAVGGGAKGVYAASGVVWFAGSNAIVKWETATSRFTSWATPPHASTKAAFIEIDTLGQAWYTSASTQGAGGPSYVGVLRGDNTFTEWQVPTAGANAQDISINPLTQNPWITEQDVDKVAKLDPSTGGTVTNVPPATIRSELTSGAVFTHVAGPTLPSTTTVAPTTSSPIMTSDEQFAEWVLDAGSGLQDIAVDASGDAWILESSTNKVARLSLASDFVVNCDPSSLDLLQGADITSTCTVTSVDGFSSAVQLTGVWSGAIPDGVAYTIPSPVTPSPGRGVSSTLTISAGPTASTGTYGFEVTATSGSSKHIAQIQVMITAGVADFTVIVSPSYLSIPPSGTGSVTITVQSLGVFFSPVQLTGSGMPEGMALVFEQNPVLPPIGGTAASTGTVALSGAPQGIHTLTISGSDGSITRSTALTVEITGGCLIATATYGSELSGEVQLLRNFRDKSILTTEAGSSFMIAFNAWYYSFSPSVAVFIREHPVVRSAARLALYPLIGILRVGGATFDLLPTGQETNAVITGVLVSCLIGSVYLSVPLLILFRYSARTYRVGRKLAVPLSAILLLALIAAASALALDAPAVLLIGATSAIVLASMAISALITSRVLLRLSTIR